MGAVLRTFTHMKMKGVSSVALLPDGLRFAIAASSQRDADLGTVYIAEHGLACQLRYR